MYYKRCLSGARMILGEGMYVLGFHTLQRFFWYAHIFLAPAASATRPFFCTTSTRFPFWLYATFLLDFISGPGQHHQVQQHKLHFLKVIEDGKFESALAERDSLVYRMNKFWHSEFYFISFLFLIHLFSVVQHLICFKFNMYCILGAGPRIACYKCATECFTALSILLRAFLFASLRKKTTQSD